MPPRDWLIRIEDILEACNRIVEYVGDKTEDEFNSDPRTVDAVIRNLTVIGEAAGHIPEEIAKRYPGTPWLEMRGIRNIVVHEYFGVSLPIIWKTVQDDIPSLIPLLQAILTDNR
ncbi:MAG: DUF86 domain-containing protein [bacterium]|nr:DUF86 domain-containing protein [bacterium]MDT8366333.1 DUF86 domain-containing protein [bacterium]